MNRSQTDSTSRSPISQRALSLASELVQIGAVYCPFLRFELRTHAESELLEPGLTGPTGTRQFLEALQLVPSDANRPGA